LVSLLRRRDAHHAWAAVQAADFKMPWHTCQAVLTEAFHIMDRHGGEQLRVLVHRGAVLDTLSFAEQQQPIFDLMAKYADVPMAFADACLVRMSELWSDSIVLTTDRHFAAYRRNRRQVVPHRRPG
jgi:uncharacterized protein